MKIFVSATDTEVGKTNFCANLAAQLAKKGRKVAYFKPFQSGMPKDCDVIKSFCPEVFTKSGYVTQTPCTPMISAQIDGIKVDLAWIKQEYEKLAQEFEDVIVEGAGGLLVPVDKGVLMRDVAKTLNLPLVIVARPNLGTINHTLMSLECCKLAGLEVLGVVINNFVEGEIENQAKGMIEEFSGLKVLSVIKHSENGHTEEDLTQLAHCIR